VYPPLDEERDKKRWKRLREHREEELKSEKLD